MQHRPSDKNLPNILYTDLAMYEDLSQILPVLVFEPSPVGVVDTCAKQLHQEKKSADSNAQAIQRETDAMVAEIMAAVRTLDEKLASLKEERKIEKQCRVDMDERHEKDMVSLWERIERLDKEIECQEEDIERLEQKLRDTNDWLRDINDRLRDINDRLRDTKDGLRDTRDGLRDTKDGLRETQATVKELQEECDFFKILHLRKLLDESRGIIASEFGASKWKTFVEKHDREHLPAVIQSKFSASLTPECIEFLCDDDSAGRFRGNKASRHEDSDKMHEAIADDEVNPTTNRQYLSMLYKFITSQTVVLS